MWPLFPSRGWLQRPCTEGVFGGEKQTTTSHSVHTDSDGGKPPGSSTQSKPSASELERGQSDDDFWQKITESWMIESLQVGEPTVDRSI